MDFRTHSFRDLLHMRRQIDEEIQARHRDAPDETESVIHETAREWGYAIDSVLFGLQLPAVPPYRHPAEPSLTWDGRGEKPGWVRDWEARGRSLEDLRAGK